jgi:hypothetical protein
MLFQMSSKNQPKPKDETKNKPVTRHQFSSKITHDQEEFDQKRQFPQFPRRFDVWACTNSPDKPLRTYKFCV